MTCVTITLMVSAMLLSSHASGKEINDARSHKGLDEHNLVSTTSIKPFSSIKAMPNRVTLLRSCGMAIAA